MCLNFALEFCDHVVKPPHSRDIRGKRLSRRTEHKFHFRFLKVCNRYSVGEHRHGLIYTLQIASNLECFSLPRVIFAHILKRFCCLPSNFHFEWTVKLGDVCSHLADTRRESLGLFSSGDVASKPRLYE